jgi:hypothetical protein
MYVFHVALAVVTLAVTFVLLAVMRAVLARLGDRAATWLLPDNQPITFRFASMIVTIADVIAPRVRYRLELVSYGVREFYVAVDPKTIAWTATAEVQADLEEALRTGLRAYRPVRAAVPVLSEAVALGVANVACVVGACVVNLVLGILGVPVKMLVYPIRVWFLARELPDGRIPVLFGDLFRIALLPIRSPCMRVFLGIYELGLRHRSDAGDNTDHVVDA